MLQNLLNICQICQEHLRSFKHLLILPYLTCSEDLKTKITSCFVFQRGIRELRSSVALLMLAAKPSPERRSATTCWYFEAQSLWLKNVMLWSCWLKSVFILATYNSQDQIAVEVDGDYSCLFDCVFDFASLTKYKNMWNIACMAVDKNDERQDGQANVPGTIPLCCWNMLKWSFMFGMFTTALPVFGASRLCDVFFFPTL